MRRKNTLYYVMVAGVCAYQSVRLSAAKRAAKRIRKQDGVWMLRTPGLLTASPKKFKGAKWFGGINSEVSIESEIKSESAAQAAWVAVQSFPKLYDEMTVHWDIMDDLAGDEDEDEDED